MDVAIANLFFSFRREFWYHSYARLWFINQVFPRVFPWLCNSLNNDVFAWDKLIPGSETVVFITIMRDTRHVPSSSAWDRHSGSAKVIVQFHASQSWVDCILK